MSELYGYPSLMTRCAECGKETDVKKAFNNTKDLAGPWYCEDCYFKAPCSKCEKEVPYSKQVGCRWGDDGHEDEAFCSKECMEDYHDGPEDDPREER